MRGAVLRLATPRTVLLLGVVEVVLAVVAVPLFVLMPASLLLSNMQSFVVSLTLTAVGVVVARRQPRNAVGWLLLVAGLGLMLGTVGQPYAELAYRQGYSGLPLARVVLLLVTCWTFTVVLLPLSLLLFPDGRLPSPRWRWVLWSYLAVNGFWLVGNFAVTTSAVTGAIVHVDSDGSLTLVNHPSGAWSWFGTAQELLTSIFVLFWISFVVRLAIGWRAATGARRAQMKWLCCGAAVCLLTGGLSVLGPSFDASPSAAMHAVENVASFGIAALPLAIGFGILKYRLYEIDRLVSRTLSYAILTGLLVGIYFAIVTLITRALPLSSPVGVAAATLAAAALFNPLRTRVQRLVDSRFNRARYDADATLAAFSAQVRDAIDLDSVHAGLIAVVQYTVAPDHASLWIKPSARGASRLES